MSEGGPPEPVDDLFGLTSAEWDEIARLRHTLGEHRADAIQRDGFTEHLRTRG
jgi:hypothetical protein